MTISSSSRSGFSLVELSVVLVIIGLVIGGVIGGQTLLENVKLQNMVQQAQELEEAFTMFQDKYEALPGDMSNATDYWGAFSGSCNAVNTPATGEATCNGDGDRKIESSAVTRENYRAWHHLSNAGFVNEFYNGSPGPSGSALSSVPGENIPKTPFGDTSGFDVGHMSIGGVFASQTYFDGTENVHIFFIGRSENNSFTNNNFFTALQAFRFDEKIDDGKAGKGFVTGRLSSACVTETSDANADISEYKVSSDDSQDCAIIYELTKL